MVKMEAAVLGTMGTGVKKVVAGVDQNEFVNCRCCNILSKHVGETINFQKVPFDADVSISLLIATRFASPLCCEPFAVVTCTVKSWFPCKICPF